MKSSTKIVFTSEDSNKIFELLWFDRYWNFVNDSLDSSAIKKLEEFINSKLNCTENT